MNTFPVFAPVMLLVSLCASALLVLRGAIGSGFRPAVTRIECR